jgi:hypothetical protein
MMLGIREHAVADFQEALKIDPCLSDARKNLRLAGVPTPTPEDCQR